MKRSDFLKLSLISTAVAGLLPRVFLKAGSFKAVVAPLPTEPDPFLPLQGFGNDLAGSGLEYYNSVSFSEMNRDILRHRMPAHWTDAHQAELSESGELL